MTLRMLVVVALIAVATDVSARAPAPLLPAALVEDVKSANAEVEFMDYVGRGQIIKLESRDVLVLSYLKSCEHETITGGTVTVGFERSEVRDGQIVRTKVRCSGGKTQLTSEQASQSAVSAFRLQSAQIQPTLYARTPLVQLPPAMASKDRTLLIERADRPGERYELRIDDSVAASGFYDLATNKILLARNAIYDASIGTHKIKFGIDAKAGVGLTPVVSRLLRFQ